ncbi:MAG: hypothetical protein ACRCUT_14660 [Spirochaetota bacterium]
MKKIFFQSSLMLICIVPFCAGSAAPLPEVKVLFSAQETTVGEPVDIIVSVSSKQRDVVIVPPAQGKYFAQEKEADRAAKKRTDEEDAPRLPVYAVESSQIEDLSTNESVNRTLKIRVLYYAPGQYFIPPVSVKNSAGEPAPIESPQITVKAVNEQGEQADIEPPLPLKGNYTRIIIMLLAAVLLGAGGYALYRYIKKRKSVPDAQPYIPAIIPFREETAQLKYLLSQEKIPAEEFSLRLSLAFRRLISAIYRFDAAEMTSREILSTRLLNWTEQTTEWQTRGENYDWAE